MNTLREKFAVSFCLRSSSRRFGWYSVILVAGANILLFFALSWVNRLPRQLPNVERLSSIEVFRAELPPKELSFVAESVPVISEADLEEREPEPVELRLDAKTFFKPRVTDWMPEILLKQPDISVGTIGVRIDSPVTADMSGAGGTSVFSIVDEVPRKIAGMPPSYPFWARQSGAEGVVTLRFLVGVDGKVYDVEVQRVDGDERFAQVARKAVEKWLFQPAIKAGKPVAAWCVQRINFELE